MHKVAERQSGVLYTTHIINVIVLVSQTCLQSNIFKVAVLTKTEKCGVDEVDQ